MAYVYVLMYEEDCGHHVDMVYTDNFAMSAKVREKINENRRDMEERPMCVEPLEYYLIRIPVDAPVTELNYGAFAERLPPLGGQMSEELGNNNNYGLHMFDDTDLSTLEKVYVVNAEDESMVKFLGVYSSKDRAEAAMALLPHAPSYRFASPYHVWGSLFLVNEKWVYGSDWYRDCPNKKSGGN